MLQLIQTTQAQPTSRNFTPQESEAAARAVIRLFGLWNLGDATAREILGGMAARTYARWKAGDFGRIDRDLATRLSLLLGIHKGLRYLFRDKQRGYDWVSKPNQVFGDRSPAEIMADGSIFSLMRVRQYLDAERGG